MGDDGNARPQVLFINPQQLKNSTKIARVVIVDENPPIMSPDSTMSQTVGSKRTTEGMLEPQDARASLKGSIVNSMVGNSINPKPLISYPEELHKPTKDDCLKFNARVMKHLMKGKMHK
jgi:hypothetical protein